MKSTMNNLKISVAALFASGMALSAQSNAPVSTPIVGFQKRTISPGANGMSFPLLNPDLTKTVVSSVSGNSVTLAGSSNVGGLLTSNEPYYIEVYSGNLKGDRFDVNTAATIAAANGTVVLDAASQNNTYPVASIGTGLNGATVALRQHITLAQIQSFSTPALVGNNNPAAADQIQIFEGDGFVSYFLRSDNVTWRKSGDTTNFAKLAVPPGTGVLINKRTSSVDLVQTGSVRQNDFATPYKAGVQAGGPSVPLEKSPSSLGMVPGSNGWVGNNNPSAADQIFIFQNGSFAPYSLRADGQLRLSGNTTNFINANLLGGSDVWLIKRKNANADLVESQQVQ